MPISSFYGLQTSLRGLLAQQRSLDTTGHNIANASTQGYSRQEAVARRPPPATAVPAGGSQSAPARTSARASTSQAYRRVRDQLPGLAVPRARTRASASGTARAAASTTPSSSLAEPGDNGINAQLDEVLGRLVGPRQRAGRPGRQQALVAAGRRAGRRVPLRRRADARPRSAGARAQYDAIAGPGGEVAKIADELARLNDTIKRSHQRRRAERPDGPPRPAARPALRATARSPSTDLADGTINVAFGGAGDHVRSSTAPTVNWPAGRLTAPGGRSAACSSARASPGGTHRRLPARDSTRSPRRSPTRSTRAYARHGPFFTYTAGAAAAHRCRVGRQAAPRASPPAPAPTGRQRPRAAQSPPLRGGAATTAYRAFVARVGADVNEANRQAGQRPGAHRLGRGPPPERRRRLARRGDVQPRALPARLPGLRARHVDDGRDARRADQPHRAGSGCEPRASPPDVQRNVLPTSTRSTERLTRTQAKASSGKEITRPSDDPYGAVAGAGAARGLGGNAAVPAQRQRRARAGRTPTEAALSTHHRRRPARPRAARPGRHRQPDQTSRDAIAKEIDQLTQALKEQRQHELRRPLPLRRAPRRRPRPTARRRRPTRATTASTRRSRLARDRPRRLARRSTRGATRSSATARRPATTSCSTSCATCSDHLAPATAPRCAAPTSPARRRASTTCSRPRAPQRRPARTGSRPR